MRGDGQLRLAAGLLDFAQCMDITVEPAIAFHELVHKRGNDTAWAELGWFRAADNAKAQDLLDLALGRQDALAGRYSAHTDVSTHDLSRPLRHWNRTYIIALRMVGMEQVMLCRKCLLNGGGDATRNESSLACARISVERIRSPEWKAKSVPHPDFIGGLIREEEWRVRDTVPDRSA